MAEIALVASIFGVASFGTKVATGLHEAADIMIHAHQQISSMAKHVSQFTAVLRHLGRVLEAEKGNCSHDLLREIRRIKHSCVATFKEINATVRSKRYRPFVPVLWLFKKPKAKELEARLDSEQSMLQVMIHTLTVSKLGDLQLKSKEDSKQISGLKEEINILKTLIVENFNNLTELHRAEQRSAAEVDRHMPPEIRQGLPPPYNSPEPLLPGHADIPDMDEFPFYKSPSPASSLYKSGHDEEGFNKTGRGARRTTSRAQADREITISSSHDAQATETFQQSSVRPLSNHNNAADSERHRASTLLLQMVPYRPTHSITGYFNQSRLLISAVPDGPSRSDTDPKPAMEEATRSVRLLLDKWTASGSAPLSTFLESADNVVQEVEGSDKNPPRKPNFSPPQPPPQPMADSSDDEIDARYPFDSEYFPYLPGASVPPTASKFPPPPSMGHPYMHEKSAPRHTPWSPVPRELDLRVDEVWRSSHAFRQAPPRHAGDSILDQLRIARGGILYKKGNDFRQTLYIDGYSFYEFDLVPSSLIPFNESQAQYTEIGKGWVRQEALDLLGYPYTETQSGHFSVSRDLEFAEIDELVRLSYRAFSRGLEERSRQVVKERDWGERVAALNQEQSPNYPRYPDRFPEVRRPRRPRNARYPDLELEDKYALSKGGHKDRFEGARSNSELSNSPLSKEAKAGNLIARPNRTERTQEGKPGAAPEVRFTLPRLTTTRPVASPPKLPLPSRKADTSMAAKELQEASEKLERLKKRKDEAEKTNDIQVASDLKYYAIPDLEMRIKALKRAGPEKGDIKPTSTADQRQNSVPPPSAVVETDTESSGDDILKSAAAESNSDLEDDSAGEDLYQ